MRAPVLLQVAVIIFKISSVFTQVSPFVMSFFQALAPLIVWAELGVGRGGEQRGKLPPRGVTLDRAREHQRGRLWPRNLGANPAKNLGPNPHPRNLGSSPARNLGSSRESGSGAPARESEREKPRRNTSTPFIRQSLPPGEPLDTLWSNVDLKLDVQYAPTCVTLG